MCCEQLTRKSVARVHMAGGSFLGVSRGTPNLDDIVDKLQVCEDSTHTLN